MLILAGVSLNAIIGDNGIITNAQNANYQNQKAILQEYFDQFYIEHYEEFGNETNKALTLQGLNASKNWIYKGKLGYVVDEKGYVHYFLIIENMPKEVRENIKIGIGEKNYTDYANCVDVWGITENLKVYYCANGIDSIDGVKLAALGKENGKDIAFSAGSNFSKAISGNSTTPLTKSDLRGITTFTINANMEISDLNEIYNLTNLKVLKLNKLTLSNLDGIEYLSKLTDIYMIDCNISNYSALKLLSSQIQKICIEKPTNDKIRDFCDSTVGIGGKDFTNLVTLGIYEVDHVGDGDNTGTSGYTTSLASISHSGFNNLEYLLGLSENTRKRIVNLYLNNNSLTNIDDLYTFTNVECLRVECNYLYNLNGIYNSSIAPATGLTKLVSLFAYCNYLGLEENKMEVSGTLSFEKDILRVLVDIDFNEELEKNEFVARFKSLKRLYVGKNAIKNLNYLSKNSNLSALGIQDTENIDLDSGFQSIMSIVEKSNFSLSADTYVTDYLSEYSKKIPKASLDSKTMTLTEFENYLSGREEYATSIILKSLVLYKDDETTLITDLTTPSFDDCLSDVLVSFTNCKAIDLRNLTYVTDLSFLEDFAPLCQEIDLRGTSVTDLQPIIDFCPRIYTVAIDNDDIIVPETKDEDGEILNSGIETLINICASGSRISGYGYLSQMAFCHGVLLYSTGLLSQLADCKNITDCCLGYDNFGPTTFAVNIDLSGCTQLNSSLTITGHFPKGLTISLPNTVETLNLSQMEGSIILGNTDKSIVNLKNTSFSHGNFNSYLDFCAQVPKIESVSYYRTQFETSWTLSNYISGEKNLTKIKSLSIRCYESSKNIGMCNDMIKDLDKFTDLEYLELTHSTRLTTNFYKINSLTKLRTLRLYNVGLNSLDFLNYTRDLETLDISYTTVGAEGYSASGEVINHLDLLKLRNAFENEEDEYRLISVTCVGCDLSEEIIVNSGILNTSNYNWTNFKYK